MKRAGKYLRDETIDTLPGKENMLAVLSKPHDSQGDEPLQAKLGGTGLGLVALLSLEHISPGSTPFADLRKLGKFLVSMQREDGSFSSKYIPSEGGVNDDWQSLYYPGEAILGLLMLYEKDSSAIWLDSASKAAGVFGPQPQKQNRRTRRPLGAFGYRKDVIAQEQG